MLPGYWKLTVIKVSGFLLLLILPQLIIFGDAYYRSHPNQSISNFIIGRWVASIREDDIEGGKEIRYFLVFEIDGKGFITRNTKFLHPFLEIRYEISDGNVIFPYPEWEVNRMEENLIVKLGNYSSSPITFHREYFSVYVFITSFLGIAIYYLISTLGHEAVNLRANSDIKVKLSDIRLNRKLTAFIALFIGLLFSLVFQPSQYFRPSATSLLYLEFCLFGVLFAKWLMTKSELSLGVLISAMLIASFSIGKLVQAIFLIPSW